MNEVVIDVKNLWFKYREGKWILRGVNFYVKKGETVLIVGPSGGGKTSLARVLTGLAVPVFDAKVEGEILLCSRPIQTLNIDEIERCVQVVNQDPYTHFLEPVVFDDLISYAERLHGNRALEVVETVVNLLKLNDVVSKPIINLSCGQLRRAAIAKSLLSNPSAIILDEPLMWLDDVEGVDVVKNVLEILKKLGKSIIIMEHRFLHLIDKADSVYVLKNGLLYSVKHLEANTNNNGVKNTTKTNNNAEVNPIEKTCTPVLELHHVWFKYEESPWILKDVSLRVCQGDAIVIYGRNGSGKSTLLRIIAGLLKPVKGIRKVYNDVLYIPQIPYLFITEDTIFDEVKAICRSRKLDNECIAKGVKTLESFGIRNMDELPINLSWGEQTRLAVLLASIVVRNGVLLLDEPFTGSTYVDSLNLIDLLINVPRITKIITLSSKDYISLIKGAKAYIIDDGHLKPFNYNDSTVLRGIEIVKTLFS